MTRVIFFLFFVFVSGDVYADLLTGDVVRVIDGDTITILDSRNKQHRIRLQGIDAPEYRQPFSRKSTEYLSKAVAGKEVVIDYERRDRYQRIVGIVLLNGQDINLRQIKVGYAWHFKRLQKYQTPEDRKLYSRAEIEARKEKRGLWVEPDPIPPWEWRKMKRK